MAVYQTDPVVLRTWFGKTFFRIRATAIVILVFLLVLLMYPAPFSPGLAIARWNALLKSRSLVASFRKATQSELMIKTDTCTEAIASETGECGHVQEVRRMLTGSFPSQGDWFLPGFNELTLRDPTMTVSFLPFVCNGEIVFANERFKYGLDQRNSLLLFSESRDIVLWYEGPHHDDPF